MTYKRSDSSLYRKPLLDLLARYVEIRAAL